MPYAKKRRIGVGGIPTRYVAPPSAARRIPIRVRRKSASRKRTMRKRRVARKVIKNVVEKVMSCKDNVGIYTKSYSGDIKADVPVGVKNVVVHGQRLQANDDDVYTSYGLSWHPYSLKRILDAASVLYKNKTPSIAGPGVLGTENFEPKGLKVDLLYCSYKLAVTNMTNTPYMMEFVEFTNKFNSNTAVMDVLIELNKGTNWMGGASPIPVFENSGGGVWHMECDMDFGMIKGLSSRYAMKSFGAKRVNPGQTINYFTKDKMCVDFQKRLVTETAGGDPEIPSFAKGQKQVVIVMHPVAALASNGTKWTFCEYTVSNDANHGLVFKVDEVFKLIEPDATLDEYQGDKRCLFSNHGVPPEGGTLNRINRDTGPYYQAVSSTV